MPRAGNPIVKPKAAGANVKGLPKIRAKGGSGNVGVGKKASGTIRKSEPDARAFVGKKAKPLAKVQGVDVPKVVRATGKAAGETAHAMYPRSKKGASKRIKNSGPAAITLPGASGGGMDIVNSAPGIVLRSTADNLVHDPKRAASDTAKSVVSIPAGLVRLTLHPKGSAEAIGRDYAHRYGAALEGDYKKFHDRQRKEGAAPELFDIAGAASVGGSATGRALQKVASAGKMGAAAKKVATETKGLRVSGGDAGVVERTASKNFYKNAARTATDAARTKVQKRRVAGSNADAVVREAHDLGQVTHIRGRKRAKVQRKMVAKQGGEALATMKAEQAREVLSGATSTAANIRGLSKHEKGGIKYASQYGIRSPEQARVVLTKLRDRIVAERKAAEADGSPLTIINDELAHIDSLLGNADRTFTPNLRKVALKEAGRSRRLAKRDPSLASDTALRRTYRPAGDLLGVEPIAKETAAQYARRVQAAMNEHGLGAPGYFKSEELPKFRHAVFAKGGRRAVMADKQYTGALTRTGRESWSPEVMVRQHAQNIKRRVNWNLVGDTVDSHALAWSKSKRYSALDLERELHRRGIDPSSVRLWNPRLFRKLRESAGEHVGDGDPTHVDAMAEQAFARASGTLNDIALNPEDFKRSGWQAIPTAAHDEVMGLIGTGGEGRLGRAYDISKGKLSRVLLANPAWLGFQVASNALMTGLAGVTPADAARAQRFFRDMTPEHRAAAEATFGVHGWFNNQRHLGATANGRFVNAFRVLKETGFYRRAQNLNPLDVLFFRPDNVQNNFFRRTIMYNRLKREAYRRMGENASAATRAQQRIVDILATGSREKVMRELSHNRDVLERHAQAVDDFLGNWTTYTTKERHVFSRAVMFYGFLRFSTRLAFYTMPAKHPIMSSILLQIGRLEKDEIKQIFGADPPPWEYGNFYASDKTWGEGLAKGESAGKRYLLVRLVPFFNAAQWESPAGGIGMLSPPVNMALNQAAGKSLALDQPYTVGGSTAYVQHSKDLSLADRVHIMTAEGLKWSPYYRAAEKALLHGKQGSDSSLLFPRPIVYKRADAKVRNDERIAQQKRAGLLGAARESLLPLLGTDADSVIAKAQHFSGKKGKSSAKPPTIRYGGSSASSIRYGGSGASSIKYGGK